MDETHIRKRERVRWVFSGHHRQGSEFRNYSVCWKCFRWERFFGWVRSVRVWPVVMTVPVPVSYTDQNLSRQVAYFHSRSLKIPGGERGSYIFLSFPPFHRSHQQLVSPYDLYRTDKQPHGKPLSLSKPTWRTQIWPTASLVLPKPCRASQPHLRNSKLAIFKYQYLYGIYFFLSLPWPHVEAHVQAHTLASWKTCRLQWEFNVTTL